MSLVNLAINVGGTCSVAGGTSKTYTPDGRVIPQGIHIADASEADFRIRPHISFRNGLPVFNPRTKMYDGKEKRFFTLTRPKLEADGTITNNYIKIEIGTSPTSTAAERSELSVSGAQLLFDSDTAEFRNNGSLI